LSSKKPAGKSATPKEAPKAKETVPGWAEGVLPEGGKAPDMPEEPVKEVEKAEKTPEKAEMYAEGGIVDGKDAMLGFESEPEMVIPAEKVLEIVERTEERAAEPAKKAQDVPKRTLETPPKAPERAEGGADPLPDTRKPEIRAALVEILNIQKGKRDIPTEVKYYSKYARADRVVIIDVNVNLLDEAWRKYCSMDPEADPEIFLSTVYSILKLEVPRMYRAVATLRLC